MANRIMQNETSYHGAGAIQEIAAEAKARAFKKAFVCSDPDLIKFGVTGKVTDVLDKAGLAYEIYSDIKANPTIENVQNGVAAFKAAKADYIVAIGGGSSMDTAKAIGIIIANPEFEDVRSLEAALNSPIRDFVLIGNLTQLPQCKEIFPKLEEMYGVRFLIPKYSEYRTAIGAALTYMDGAPIHPIK